MHNSERPLKTEGQKFRRLWLQIVQSIKKLMRGESVQPSTPQGERRVNELTILETESHQLLDMLNQSDLDSNTLINQILIVLQKLSIYPTTLQKQYIQSQVGDYLQQRNTYSAAFGIVKIFGEDKFVPDLEINFGRIDGRNQAVKIFKNGLVVIDISSPTTTLSQESSVSREVVSIAEKIFPVLEQGIKSLSQQNPTFYLEMRRLVADEIIPSALSYTEGTTAIRLAAKKIQEQHPEFSIETRELQPYDGDGFFLKAEYRNEAKK